MKDSQKQKKKKRLFKNINKLSPVRRFEKKRSNIKTTKKSEGSDSDNKKNNLQGNKLAFTLRKYESVISLFLIPVFLFLVLLTITTINSKVLASIQNNKLVSSDVTKMVPYPVVMNPTAPFLSAKAAVVTDSSSQTILFSKNPTLRFSMASTAKIMTALTALDYYQSDSIITIKSYGTEGSVLGLRLGDSFYFQDLLYAMLLPSANDAALAIADNYPGGSEKFIERMNDKAKIFHLIDTHFSDPIGLDDDGDYSTVVDLGRLAAISIQNKQFAKVAATKQKTISNVDGTHQYSFSNLNKLLGVQGVTGIKTGTTEGAGEVLVTSSVVNGHTFIIVVMNSQDRFSDTQKLLNFASENIQFINPGDY